MTGTTSRPTADALAQVLNRVRRLEDERAIEQTVYAFGDAIDTESHERWLSLFTPDGRFAWRPARGDQRANAPDGTFAWITSPSDSGPDRPWVLDLRGSAQLRNWAIDQGGLLEHGRENHVSRPVIFVSLRAEQAETLTWYLILRHELGTTTLVSTGRYRDRLVRRDDGTWLIQERLAEGVFPSGL
jgi:hypothetical protein